MNKDVREIRAKMYRETYYSNFYDLKSFWCASIGTKSGFYYSNQLFLFWRSHWCAKNWTEFISNSEGVKADKLDNFWQNHRMIFFHRLDRGNFWCIFQKWYQFDTQLYKCMCNTNFLGHITFIFLIKKPYLN